MRLLIVSQYFFPEQFVISQIASDLKDLGHGVTVLTGMPNYPSGALHKGYRSPFPRREMYQGIEIIRVPIIPRGRTRALQLMLNYASFAISAGFFGPIFLFRRSIDAIFVYEPSPITVGLPAILLKWLKRVPVVFWVQDLWPESLAATGAIENETLLGLVRNLVRFIYKHCNVILIQSRAFESKVRAMCPTANIRYLPNPADKNFEQQLAPTKASERRLMPEGFCIVFAGNMGIAQDLDNVLEAAKLTRDLSRIKWILIGAGRERASLEEQVRTNELNDTVFFLGPYPSASMPEIFADADALLVTLRKSEIFSLTVPSKVQAYLACGRPILAAIDGEGARLIEDAGAGLVCPPGNPHALANAARALLNMQPSEMDRMGQSGRRYYEREFDRTMLIERLNAWLHEAREEEDPR